MPGFGFPPGVAGGGGGGGGTAVVTGGSGATYPSITAGLLGETQTVVADTTQAGTAAGSITGSGGLSAIDNFYKDFWVVLTDATPGNGLVCRYARVSAYVGATKVLTLDQPWNFGVGETYSIINPVRLWVSADLTENVTINKSVELNLDGHRIVGTVDITAAPFCWIRGTGWITDGIQKTDIGMLRCDDLAVSRRGATIYALLMTNGSDLGRTVLYNCQFDGAVSGRRGFAGWEIDNCRNSGVIDANSLIIPYRLFESVAGVAVVVSSADVLIVSSVFAGVIFYSENSITGATAYVNIHADISVTPEYVPLIVPTCISIYHAIGGATLTMSIAANFSRFRCFIYGDTALTVAPITPPQFTMIRCTSFTGTLNLTLTNLVMAVDSPVTRLHEVVVDGAVAMSGSITTVGGTLNTMGGQGTTIKLLLNIGITGTIAHGLSTSVSFTNAVIGILFQASQTAGAPVCTVSGSMTGMAGGTSSPWAFSAGISISVGTWTHSGANNGRLIGVPPNPLVNLTSVVSGGTWAYSGGIEGDIQATGNTFALVRHAGSGGTLTVSGNINLRGLGVSTCTLVQVTGAGATVNVSSITNLRGFVFLGATVMIQATTATSTATWTGATTFMECQFVGSVQVMDATAVGGVAQAPASLLFYNCTFESTFTDRNGLGTLTLAAATWRFYDCVIVNLITLLGTSFTTLEFFETTFQGNSANNSITITGTRPTTYRLWKCTYVANIGLLLPEIIDEYTVLPAAAAIAAGNLLTVDAAGAAAAQTAGGRNQGVALAATAGAAEPVVMVRRGRVFVDAEAATVAGSSCVVDAGGTPTRMIPGASVVGQTIGIALEADGTTRAGESYTVVDLC